jgi:hypothetical protein
MANIVANRPQFTVTGTDNYILTDIGDGAVGELIIDFKVLSAITGTVAIKARAKGAADFKAVYYTPLHVNGSAADPTVPVTTAISSASLIALDATGMQISIDAANLSAGSFTVTVNAGSTR